MAGAALQGAASARYNARVVALGRAFASRLLESDEAAIDLEFLFVHAISALDMVHVRFLTACAALITGDEPDARGGVLAWMIDERYPQLAVVYEQTTAQLSGLGVMAITGVDGGNAAQTRGGMNMSITEFGWAVLGRLRQAGLEQPSDQPVSPS